MVVIDYHFYQFSPLCALPITALIKPIPKFALGYS